MDKEKETPFPGGAVPIPNRLFDEVLPGLKDTELRVLLIVLRQTLGWREGSDTGGGWQYKKRDWISHSQMVKKTGRGSEAISRAVDALVQHGLLVVETAAGKPLITPAERRRCLGRLYYRPGENVGITDRAVHPAKAKTTTDTRYNIKKNLKKTDHLSLSRRGISGWQHPVR